jgi:hypothetical protein
MTSTEIVPRKRRTSLWRALGYIIDAAVSPAEAFKKLRDENLSVVMLLAAFALLAVVAEIPSVGTIRDMLSSLGAEGRSIPAPMQSLAYASLVTAPLVLVIKVIIIGYTLWMGVAVLAESDLPIPTLIGTAALAQIVPLLHTLTTSVIIRYTGNYLHPTMAEIGLNQLFTAPGIAAFLAFINPFTIWYSVLLFFGVRTVCQLSNRKTAIAMLPYLALTALVVLIQLSINRSSAI